MRDDMSKVVIERPRSGHSLPGYKTRLRIRHYDPEKDYEDLPKRVSGSRSKYVRAGETKYFSDFLSPLRRFLRTNVGRPWDKVYSEMRKSEKYLVSPARTYMLREPETLFGKS